MSRVSRRSLNVPRLRGMDQRWNASPDTARRIENLGWDGHDGWHDLGGFREIVHDDSGQGSNPFSSSGVIDSLMWFAQHNGAKQWLLWETNGELQYFLGSTPTVPFAAIADLTGRTLVRTQYYTPWQGSTLTTWGDRAYILNGVDEPVVFNGDWASPVGYRHGPGSVYVVPVSGTTSHGTTLVDLGLGVWAASGETRECGYTYRFSFVNEYGQESPLSPVSRTVLFENSDTTRLGTWVELPLGPAGTVARRVYRSVNFLNSNGQPFSLGEGEVHYFRLEVQDNCTTSFEDFLPDTGLGAEVDASQLGPFPAGVKYASEFKGSMFVANTDENGVRYSRPGFPEVFPPLNFIPLGSSQHGPITGMRPTKNALVVFRSHAIFLIKGNAREGFASEPLTYDTGCAAPNSIQEIPGKGLAFLSEQGVWLLEGALENTGTVTGIVRISTPIPDEIERLNASTLIGASAAVSHRRHEYWLAVPSLSQTRPDQALVWNYEVNAWSVYTDLPATRLLETGDQRQYLMFSSHDSTRPGVYVISRGWADNGGSSVSPRWESAVMDFGSLTFNVHPRYLVVEAVTTGDNTLGLDYRVNRKVVWHRVDDLGEAMDLKDQQAEDDRLQVYDTAAFGTGVWGAYRPEAIRYDLYAGASPAARSFQFELKPTNRRVHISGFDLFIDEGQPKAKPLNVQAHSRSV